MQERRQTDKARLESLLRISQYRAKTVQDLLDYALDEAIALTQSKIGYIYFYNEANRQFVLNTWSRGVMDVCTVMEPQSVYDLDKTGLWGEAVRQARPIVMNDYSAPDSMKKGYPEGHASLSRFMTVPVFSQGAIVAVLGLANKKGVYTEADIHQVTLMMNAVWQIAERKRMEEELVRSRQMLRQVISTLPVCIFWKDAHLQYLGCNDHFAREAGLQSPEEILGKTDHDLAWKDEAQTYEQHDLAVLQSGQPDLGYEEQVPSNTDGSMLWMRKHKVPLKDASGKVTGILGTAEDISEFKKDQLRIARLAAIVDASDDAIIGADLEGIITDWNRGAENIYGFKDSEIIGRPISVLAPREKHSEVHQMMASIKAGRHISHFETRRIRKNGEPFYISLSISAILDKNQRQAGFSIIGRDVTEGKKNEAELQRYRDFIINIQDACFEFDLHGRATFCNGTAHRMLGYTRDEYMNLQHHERYKTKEQADGAFQIYHDLYRTDLPARVFEAGMLCKDGSDMIMEMSISVMRNDDGVITGFRGVGRDITARNKARSELERYRNFIENISDGCFELDLKGNIIFVNDAVEKRMGYANGSLLGVNNRAYTSDEESKRMFDVFRKIYLTGEPATVDDHILYDKDRNLRYLSMSVSLMRDAGGTPIGFRGTARDNTEKKRIQDALEKSEARYRNMFQYNKAVMLLIDPASGDIVDANLAACYYYQYSREELLSRKISDLNASTKEQVFEEMRKARHEDRSHFFFEHRLANGNIHPVEVFSGPIEIGGKQLLYSIIHDITDRRKAEKALRFSEEKYRTILDNISEGYFESDLIGDIVFANDSGCAMIGCDRETLYQINYRQFSTPQTKKRLEYTFGEVLKSGEYSKMDDYEIVRQDGSIRIHQLSVSLIRDASGAPAGFRTVARDVTEKKQAEEALRQSEERIRLLFRNIPVPTFVWKAQKDQFVLSEFNSAAFQFIGDKIIDSVGKHAEEFFAGMPQISADIRKCMASGKNVENQFWIHLDDRSEMRYVVVKYAFAPPDSVLMHVNDITGQKRAEENLQFISIHDSLTGLFNRFYADAEIRRLSASRLRPVSVIVIDLNSLKNVNDEYGHALGDMYIRNSANILKQTFRPEDMIARIGGDEFLVLLPLVDEGTCTQAIERLQEYIRLFNQNNEYPVSLAAGFATARAGDNLPERIREADQNMYREKSAFKAARASS